LAPAAHAVLGPDFVGCLQAAHSTGALPRSSQEAREAPVTLGRMDEVHLSRDAYERLRKEADWRSGARRDEISQWIERAREHGDIRENADFDAAKNEQGHNEARVRHLEALLRAATVVEGPDGDVVAPGTVVEVRMDDEDATTHYLVGSIEERHDRYDVLSTSSPLGQALMGASPGDVVGYEGPRRTFQVEVVSVKPLAG
jgi:transcription elongation factor GreA